MSRWRFLRSRVPSMLARATKARESGDMKVYDEELLRICTALEVPPPSREASKRRSLSQEERATVEQRLRSRGIM